MLERAGQMLVERRALAFHPFDQLDRELARAVVGMEAFEQQCEVFTRGAAANVYLIERLERELSPQMSQSHDFETAARSEGSRRKITPVAQTAPGRPAQPT